MGWMNANRDPRWQGRPAHYLTVFTLRNFLLFAFSIIVLVESQFYKKRRGTSTGTWDSRPHNFWLRIGIALLSDSILTILTSICIFKGNWHPIAALSTSIVWCGLWTLCATWNALFAARDEVEFDRVEEWYRLCYAEVGLQVAMAVAYVGMAWFAGVAVSRWRKGGGKREGEGEV